MTSNVISPGPIEGTEGVDRLMQEKHRESMIRGIPVGRAGTVRDISDATVYLFGDAGSYVNGSVLVGKRLFLLWESEDDGRGS